MAYTIPADNHVVNDTGHTTDHNNLIDIEGLLARAAAQSVNLGSAADPAGNAGNVSLLQTYVSTGLSHAPNLGLQLRTGGGTITTSNITAAQTAGYTGMFLDPTAVWHLGGVVFNGIQNFTIESRMIGSIGWNGGVVVPSGYIDTGSGQDGIQVYAATPGGATATQGIIFRNCVFQGSNTRAVIHFGGGQRKCGLVDCLVNNTNSAAGAYAVVHDTALSDNNGEDNIFSFTGGGGLAGAYAALGIGIGDQTQHVNDTWYYGLVTHGGTYSINHAIGGNHTFHEFYDRSNPSTATVLNSGGGRMTFRGGEHQNSTGLSFQQTGSGNIIVDTGAITQTGAATTTVNISAGNFIMRGACTVNSAQTWALSGSGVIDLTDPAIVAASATISGSAGTLMLAGNYPGVGSPPVLTSFTGTYAYLGTSKVATGSGTGQTTTQTVSWTPPPANCRFRVSVWIVVTTAGTSTIPTLAYTRLGGNVVAATAIPMIQLGGTAVLASLTANGQYSGTFEANTDNSAAAVNVVITPTGSTYTYSVVIEQIT